MTKAASRILGTFFTEPHSSKHECHQVRNICGIIEQSDCLNIARRNYFKGVNKEVQFIIS